MAAQVARGVAPTRAGDAVAVRIAAAVRITVAVGLAASGSFLPHLTDRTSAFFLVEQLGYVPFATAIFFASSRPGNPLAVIGGPAGDLLMLFGVQVLLPASGTAVLLGYVVIITMSVFTVSRRVAAVLAAEAVLLAALGQPIMPASDRLAAGELVPYCAAVLALLFLLERSATRQAVTEELAARLRSKADTILAHVADAVVVTDASGTIVEGNPAVEFVVGKPLKAVLGRGCQQALGLHRGERLLDCSNGCALVGIAGGPDGEGCELWRTTADDRRQPLLANVSEVASADGRREFVHTLRDVTRLKEAEEAKNLFLATASHELKTPLTVIQGFADTLTRFPDLDPATKKAALAAIRTRSIDLARIVDRLLMSSRIEAGRANLVVGDIDIGPLLVERTESMAAATGRRIAYSGPSRSLFAAANGEALVTVVDHLLDNALKYSPGGEPVEVDVVETAERVGVAIVDHGIGMGRDEARHCFDKFWQAESSDVRRYGGTGIGLYIVQSMVEAMGGTVSVESDKGAGSTFTVQLSARAPAVEGLEAGVGESTSIREFMRQIGVDRRARA